MKRGFFLPGRPGTVLALATLVLMPLGATAQSREPAHRAGSDATYRDDRAACLRESEPQARSDCLREVAAAQASRRAARPRVDESPEALARNALQRCQAFSGERRTLCERLARGEGEVSGSVDSGGLLRRLETVEPAPAAPPPSVVPLAPGVTVPAPPPAPPAGAPVPPATPLSPAAPLEPAPR